jgi:FixJ family two-component response regulator
MRAIFLGLVIVVLIFAVALGGQFFQ